MQSEELTRRIGLACSWLTDVAMVGDEAEIGEVERQRHLHQAWKGALRGEYRAATKSWSFFCPVWHTGQAVKALVMASQTLGDAALIGHAAAMARFIVANTIRKENGESLVLAYENFPDKVNTSAILECLDGLLMLSTRNGDHELQRMCLSAVSWVASNAYIAGEGIFKDLYSPDLGSFIDSAYGTKGRPLLDDCIFLKAWRLTEDGTQLRIAVETADRLLLDERPAGNWIMYEPCNKEKGNIHPRHAYWWGRPMLDMFKETGEKKYLAAFCRSVEWYRAAMRRDGGIFRGTYEDFSTDSFGHATSGTACAISMFVDYLDETGDKSIVPYIEKGLSFCSMMQMTAPEDPNLRGVVIEKVLPPDGTDKSPYHIRDLGTIFFVQAASKWLALEVKNKR